METDVARGFFFKRAAESGSPGVIQAGMRLPTHSVPCVWYVLLQRAGEERQENLTRAWKQRLPPSCHQV